MQQSAVFCFFSVQFNKFLVLFLNNLTPMQNLPDKLYDVDSIARLEQIAINQFDIPAYELKA